jgi:thiosulfate dehydrogenase
MRRFALGVIVGILIVPLGVFAAGSFGLFDTAANVVAPRWEKAFAHRALVAAAHRRATHLQNPVAPTEANLRVGMKLFKDNCAGCHGVPNAGSDTSTGLYPPAPHFAAHPPTEPDWQLYWIVKHGVRYSGMFSWDGQLGKDSTGRDVSDERIWTIVTFLHHLDSLPAPVAAEWQTTRQQ